VQPVSYRPLNFTVGLAAVGVLVLGIVPGLVIALVQNAAQWLIAGAG
jgi:NADH:ubiquinone oxidoreductase subunit 2 (subunit N)